MKILAFLFSVFFFLSPLHSEAILQSDFPSKPLILKGKPYALGFQHGKKLKEAIAQNVKKLIDDKILNYPEHPQIRSFLDSLPNVIQHLPEDYIQEIQGLAEGAEIPYEKILLLNLFPEMFHCSGLTVSGSATKNKELFHVRVLDYSLGMDLQNTAVLMMIEREGKIPFLSVSYAGFIGVVTGMNCHGIAAGEIGGKGYGNYDGMPMSFLLRKILEESQSLADVKEILAKTKRTCEYYYVFSDGKSKESIGVYATSKSLQFIEPGSSYALFDTSFASDAYGKAALNQSQIQISPHQTLFYRDAQKKEHWGLMHQQPQDCLILTGFTHPARYPVLVQRILSCYGEIGIRDLQEIIKNEAGLANNLHTAIFAPSTGDVFVAHAGPKEEPAWNQPYTHFNINLLLKSDVDDP